MNKIVFVCLGNICRSPSGEAVFKKIINDEDLNNQFYIDSAGTSAFHVGEGADRRMIKHGKKRGYNLTSKSRQFRKEDLESFDYIIAMDSENYRDILRLDRQGRYGNKVKLMTDFSTKYFGLDVPDPYYGGDKGFEEVLNILEESCGGFLTFLKKNGEVR